MPKSIVTGGAGFIGSHVVDHLIKEGHEVVVLDDLSGGNKENVNPKATFVQGSILDTNLVSKTFEENQFDYVYHLAAYAAEGLSHFVRKFNYQNNVIGSVNLINASVKHDIKCFVYASSIAVYGRNTLPMHEGNSPSPLDPYGIAKYAVELDLQAAHKMFGLNHITFRPHNVYGERQNINDPYRNVIGIFMKQILKKQPLTIFGDGHQTRAFSYIDDVAPYIANAVNIERAYNDTFNIGTDHTCTVNELAEKVLNTMNADLPISHLAERKEVLHAHADHHKLRTVFHINENEQIGIDEGLKRMANWAGEQKIEQGRKFDSLEIDKNLPENWK